MTEKKYVENPGFEVKPLVGSEKLSEMWLSYEDEKVKLVSWGIKMDG